MTASAAFCAVFIPRLTVPCLYARRRLLRQKWILCGWLMPCVQATTGAATGPSGWGSNLLSVLADDELCVAPMAYFVSQIISNRLPPTVRTLLTTSFLVSIKKDMTGAGRRPVAIGDMFCRLAGRYAASLVQRDVQTAVAPHQYGAGLSDGCTQVVHSVQHLLTTSSAPPAAAADAAVDASAGSGRPMACLSIDLQNAFNSVSRAAMLRAVYANPDLRWCWRMVDFAYGSSSLLLMQCDDSLPDSDAFVESRTGVRQGDPAGYHAVLPGHGAHLRCCGCASQPRLFRLRGRRPLDWHRGRVLAAVAGTAAATGPTPGWC